MLTPDMKGQRAAKHGEGMRRFLLTGTQLEAENTLQMCRDPEQSQRLTEQDRSQMFRLAFSLHIPATGYQSLQLEIAKWPSPHIGVTALLKPLYICYPSHYPKGRARTQGSGLDNKLSGLDVFQEKKHAVSRTWFQNPEDLPHIGVTALLKPLYVENIQIRRFKSREMA